MKEEFVRTALLVGEEGIEKLSNTRIAVFGIGGVGGYAVEALARVGVGGMELFDGDVVAPSNINRQIIALGGTIGRYKADVAAERAKSINSDISVVGHNFYLTAETVGNVDFTAFDYVIDAVDDIAAKVIIAAECARCGVPVIACMGAGNKFDPMAFKVSDISKTKVCPLARVMRKKYREAGISHLKVVYSEEEPLTPRYGELGVASSSETAAGKTKRTPGSLSFVPPAAGLLIASEVVKDILGIAAKK